MTIDYRNVADEPTRLGQAASRVYATLAVLLILTFLAGSSTLCYSIGYSSGYRASERQNIETAPNRDTALWLRPRRVKLDWPAPGGRAGVAGG